MLVMNSRTCLNNPCINLIDFLFIKNKTHTIDYYNKHIAVSIPINYEIRWNLEIMLLAISTNC